MIYEETPSFASKPQNKVRQEPRNRISSLSDELHQFLGSDNILNFDNLENKNLRTDFLI